MVSYSDPDPSVICCALSVFNILLVNTLEAIFSAKSSPNGYTVYLHESLDELEHESCVVKKEGH